MTKKFTLTSDSFKNKEHLAKRHVYHGCGGDNQSPQLTWSNAPKETKSFALLVHDPDAPGKDWVHWVLFDIPTHQTSLPGNITKDGILEHPAGAKQGINDFGKIGYDGPCPPSGTHRYFFDLFALDVQMLGVKPGASAREVRNALEGHVLASAGLIGLYRQ